MQNDTARPSVFAIIRSDLVALVGLLLPAAFLAIYLATDVFGFFPGIRGRDALDRGDAPFFLYLGLAAAAVGIPLFLWRVRNFQSLFAQGAAVTGQITNVQFSRDRGRVDYAYQYEGVPYSGWNAVSKNKRTRSLEVGEAVTLLVSKDNPKKAAIKDIYV
ncbi:MAG TPA: DUF3592 domain-containing protein [Chloroflexia bacterium]|jgi:hypothetical protein